MLVFDIPVARLVTPTLLPRKRGCYDRQTRILADGNESRKKAGRGDCKEERRKATRLKPTLSRLSSPEWEEKFWRFALFGDEADRHFDDRRSAGAIEITRERPTRRKRNERPSLSLESSRKVCLKGIRHHASWRSSSVPANCKAGGKIVLFKLAAERDNTRRVLRLFSPPPSPRILSFLPYELNGRPAPRYLVNNSRRPTSILASSPDRLPAGKPRTGTISFSFLFSRFKLRPRSSFFALSFSLRSFYFEFTEEGLEEDPEKDGKMFDASRI